MLSTRVVYVVKNLPTSHLSFLLLGSKKVVLEVQHNRLSDKGENIDVSESQLNLCLSDHQYVNRIEMRHAY